MRWRACGVTVNPAFLIGAPLYGPESAAHGAASAPIDKEQLHYLLSRGHSPEQAEALIVEGFLVNTFSSLRNQIISEDLKTRLKIHLECGIIG